MSIIRCWMDVSTMESIQKKKHIKKTESSIPELLCMFPFWTSHPPAKKLTFPARAYRSCNGKDKILEQKICHSVESKPLTSKNLRPLRFQINSVLKAKCVLIHFCGWIRWGTKMWYQADFPTAGSAKKSFKKHWSKKHVRKETPSKSSSIFWLRPLAV